MKNQGWIKLMYSALFVAVIALGFFVLPAAAQQDEYRLNVNRVFGYSSGSQIRGTFNMAIIGPSDIQSVTYLIDGNPIVTLDQAPFKYQWKTTDYTEGWHDLSAIVQTTGGNKITTAVRRFQFASSADESSTMKNIMFPILGGVFLLLVIGLGSQMLILRKRPKVSLPLGAPRKYGINGGVICPKCGRPFPMHWWAFNMGITTRYDRCDYCGKWSMVHRASSEALAEAERAELIMAQPEEPIKEKTEEEKLKEMMDSARYTDQS